MRNQKHEVHLPSQERKTLLNLISAGRNKAAVLRRAHILLKVDEGKTDAEIKDMFYVSEQTIRRTRLRYAQEGLQAALADRPHPTPTPKLDESQEARLVATGCSPPPAGQARWTLELLVKHLLQDKVVASIAPETVRLLLKKNHFNLGA